MEQILGSIVLDKYCRAEYRGQAEVPLSPPSAKERYKISYAYAVAFSHTRLLALEHAPFAPTKSENSDSVLPSAK